MLPDAYALLADGGRVISVGAASGHPPTIDFGAEPMTMKHKRVETFMTAWPVGQDLQHVIQLAEEGQLDAQIGYRDWWHDFDAAIGKRGRPWALSWTFAAKINKHLRHARVLSKYPGVSCQSSLHLDRRTEHL